MTELTIMFLNLKPDITACLRNPSRPLLPLKKTTVGFYDSCHFCILLHTSPWYSEISIIAYLSVFLSQKPSALSSLGSLALEEEGVQGRVVATVQDSTLVISI